MDELKEMPIQAATGEQLCPREPKIVIMGNRIIVLCFEKSHYIFYDSSQYKQS